MDAIISVKKDFDPWDSAASRNLCDEKYKDNYQYIPVHHWMVNQDDKLNLISWTLHKPGNGQIKD